MKYISLVIFVLLLSCQEKDNRICYDCTITYVITTDVPVDGYPSVSTVDIELCDATPEQVDDFEEASSGTETAVVNGILYTQNYTTRCVLRQ
jgi:hypothetical protein